MIGGILGSLQTLHRILGYPPMKIFFRFSIIWETEKKFFRTFFGTMTQNSAPSDPLRPEELMEELGIKKDAYYKDVNYLGIEVQKDSEGKAYLTQEQANQIRALRSYVAENRKRNGFEYSAIVKADNSNLTTSTKENQPIIQENQPDIYVKPSEPTAQFDLNQIMREAAELKARELAMPHLVKKAVAERMTEDDLPEDLKEKVAAVREAANPKYTPAEVASNLLEQWRSSLGGN